jgi:hypothetical protein
LIHQHALEDGLFNQTVKKAFNKAKTSGRYDNVLRRDWAGMDEDYDIGEKFRN